MTERKIHSTESEEKDNIINDDDDDDQVKAGITLRFIVFTH